MARNASIDLPNGRALVMKHIDEENELSVARASLALSCRKSSVWTVEAARKMVRQGSFEICKEELEFGSKIGEGAMAVVLKANWRGKPCAAKMLKHGATRDTTEFQDLVSELSILTTIGCHRNLVQFYGAHIQDQQTPIIVQELIDGPDLDTFLQRKPAGFNLGKTTIYRWTLDILSALHHLHDRDPIIMHRDLKPANILIANNLKVLKLTDFGLAKQLSQDERMNIAHAGCTGSLRYMAPEVLGYLSSGSEAEEELSDHAGPQGIVLVTDDKSEEGCVSTVYTEKADIYSASLVMWYLLTGMQPYIDVSKQPLGRPSASLAKARWLDMAVLLELMWHPQPERRPSAGECLDYLHGLDAGCGRVQCCTTQ